MLLAKALFPSTRIACGFFRIEKSDMLFSETYRFQVFAYDILPIQSFRNWLIYENISQCHLYKKRES